MPTFDITTPGHAGLWIHKTETALGHLHEIAALGFTWIAPKLWEDGSLYGDPAAFRQLCADAATINLPVVPWGYSRPHEIEAQIAIVSEHLPDNTAGIIIDAESEWEVAGTASIAPALCHGIAEAIGHRVPLHLSSFYAPDLHPQFPYAAFLAHCESFMPQSYIEGGTPSDLVVSRTMNQAYTLATQCGKALVPTVNDPALLSPFRASGVRACSVWLYDGSAGGPDSDYGVLGRESAWQGPLAAFRA